MKILRYLVALGMLVSGVAYAIDWNAGFEATPSAGSSISEGPARIIETKVENRKRAAVEHDWDSIGVDQGASNSGRHLLGSARVFTDATDCTTITTLLENDQLGINTLDDGRLCWDKDNTTLYGWDIDAGPAAWVQLAGPVVVVPEATAALSIDTATGSVDLSTTSTYTTYTTDGTASDLQVSVTCPASAGNYAVSVAADVLITSDITTKFSRSTYTLRLTEDVDGGGYSPITTTEIIHVLFRHEIATNIFISESDRPFIQHVRPAAAASSVYSYRVEIKSALADTITMTIGTNHTITAMCVKVP